MSASASNPEKMTVRCCVAGGGPAGVMLALLLARAGVEVLVLEKHKDFFRDFRGGTRFIRRRWNSCIGEGVTAYDPATQQRLAATQASFMARGADTVTAMREALGALKLVVRREANIMAYNDAFLVVTAGLAVAAMLVWICKRPEPGKAGAGEG